MYRVYFNLINLHKLINVIILTAQVIVEQIYKMATTILSYIIFFLPISVCILIMLTASLMRVDPS